MKAVSFAQTPPSLPQTQPGTPGPNPATPPPVAPTTPDTPPGASFGNKPNPKFGCALEAVAGCCLLPVTALLGFVGFNVYKGVKKVGNLANKPLNDPAPQGPTSSKSYY
jgi:hypothetical protein